MSTTTLPASIGLFGLGLIGTAIAGHLIKAGVDVRGFDPDPAAMDRLQAMGGKPVATELVWEADCIVSAVFSTDQLGDLISAAPPSKGKRLVSVSTCDPSLMPGLAVAAKENGYELVESPISGTSADLASGDAILLVAGEKAITDTLSPMFETLSRAHFYVGEMGNGNRAKLAINLILGLSRAAVAEGVVFAKAIGLDPDDFLQLALQSAASSKVMASKGPKMVSRDFSALGRVTQCAKDADLIHKEAVAAGQGLPMLQRYRELLAASIGNGEGDLDNSAVLLEIERTPATS